MPKAAVLDPQGNAVRDAMQHLGMPEVRSVRIGKYMDIDIDGQNGELESRLHRLCRDCSRILLSKTMSCRQRSSQMGRWELEVGKRRTPMNRQQASDSDKSRAGAQLRQVASRRPT